VRITIAALTLLSLFAQEAPKPSFEVVSIRPGAMTPAQCPDQPLRAIGISCGGPGTSDPERYTGHSVPLKGVIQRAFGVEPLQLIGPDWITTASYDITAVVPPGATREQFNQMMQVMLEDRFNLKVHHEMREFPAYNLVLAKGGLKLKEKISLDACAGGGHPLGGACPERVEYAKGIKTSSSERSFIIVSPPRAGGKIQTGQGVTMDMIAKSLQRELHGPVVTDKTGLEGKYDFRLEFSPLDPSTAGEFSAPSLFAAIEKDLGLKVERTRTQLDCIVIDHIERPSEN